MHRAIPGVVAAFAFGLNVANPTSAAPDPYQIYAHARSVWLQQHYPAYVSYVVDVAVDENGVMKTDHYRSLYDSAQDLVHVDAVSLEEHANPHVPTGVNMSVRPKRQFQTIFSQRVGRTEDVVDFLGVPQLAPNYSFGIAPYITAEPTTADAAAARDALVAEIRNEYHDPMSAQKAQDLNKSEGLKQIAIVATANRGYVMTYVGVEQLSGHDTYHVSLRPLHPNGHLRLRELWVDTQTFTTSQLVTQGNFMSFGDVPWTVTFTNVDGANYIASETANAPLRIGPHLYDRASISFESIASTQPSLPVLNTFVAPQKTLVEPLLH